MAEQYEIKEIDTLLKQVLGDNIKVINYNTKTLTEPGENYGSLMLAVNVNIEDCTTDVPKTKCLSLVAKLPPSNQWIQEMFNSPLTFEKEIGFYKSIIPTLQSFQIENGMEVEIMNFFPKLYGARFNLNNTNVFDPNAVIMMENVKELGFDIGDRFVGFDYDTTKLILNDLAVFHAVPIALKLKKPDVFNEKLMPYLKKVTLFDLGDDIQQRMLHQLVEIVENNNELKKFVPRVEKNIMTHTKGMNDSLYKSEPFSTMCHCDYWVNNTLLKYDANGKPIKNMMVDFQILEYASLGNDVVFFLHSSVKQEVLDERYDDLLHVYYAKFIYTLKKFNCDIGPFAYESFLEELKMSANQMQFYHVLVMYKPIFMKKEGVKEDVSPEIMLSMDKLSDGYYEKFYGLVKHFIDRNWI